MRSTHITNRADLAEQRMLSQYQGRPILTNIIRAIADAVQTAEDISYPVGDGRQLANAVGVQLDHIGELVGLARNGLTDSQYTVLLLGTIAQNNSKADNETLLTILLNVFEAKAAQVVSPFSMGHSHRRAPATVGFEVGSPAIDPALFTVVLNLLQNSIAAGVSMSWVSVFDADDAFALAGSAGGKGLADSKNPGSGGKLASCIFSSKAN